eukprot:1543488-Lingulodinium_polyedra.AAC.1
MVDVALQWQWYRFTSCLLLAFYSVLRCGEVLAAVRQDLVLPEDLCRDAARDPRVYLNIGIPKTRGSYAKVQYARSDHWA